VWQARDVHAPRGNQAVREVKAEAVSIRHGVQTREPPACHIEHQHEHAQADREHGHCLADPLKVMKSMKGPIQVCEIKSAHDDVSEIIVKQSFIHALAQTAPCLVPQPKRQARRRPLPPTAKAAARTFSGTVPGADPPPRARRPCMCIFSPASVGQHTDAGMHGRILLTSRAPRALIATVTLSGVVRRF